MAAINKRKILEAAQRNLQKGALDKVLKDYQTILDADPRDSNVRLKLGDLQLRRGQTDDAIAAYLKVADQFMRDGFDAKAVAIYKQITKIDAKRHDIQVPLADLYVRLGLVSEAMGALQIAADAYHREGRKREALDLLRRMASLDPANVTSRLKVAALLQQEGLEEEAVAEYAEAAAELERQGDWEARIGVLDRILEMRPDRAEALEALATILFEHQQARRAEPIAAQLVVVDAGRPECHELYARILSELGRERDAIEHYRRSAEGWRERGVEERAREIMQRLVPAEPFGTDSDPRFGGRADAPGTQSSPFAAGGSDLGGAYEPVPLDQQAPALPSPDEDVLPLAAAAPARAPEREAPVEPAGDVEQLLAEASVYLRYGKHERAIASLEAAVASAPEHSAALEQLADAHLATGARARAVELLGRAARAADGDAARVDALHARLAELDPAAAAALAPRRVEAPPTVLFELDDEEAAPDDTGSGRAALDADELADIEIDVDADGFDEVDEPLRGLGEDGEEPAVELGETPAAPDPAGVRATRIEGEIEIDADALAAADADAAPAWGADGELDLDAELGELDWQEGRADDALEAPSSAELDEALEADVPAQGEPEAAPEAWEISADERLARAAEAVQAIEPSSPAAATGNESAGAISQRIVEDFEEAGFYFEQGLLEEAEAIYRRILQRAPGHPGALLRMGEIAVRRGHDPGDSLRALRAGAGDTTERSAEASTAAAGFPSELPGFPAEADDVATRADTAAAELPEIEPLEVLDLTELADDEELAGPGPDAVDSALAATAESPAAPVGLESELTAPDGPRAQEAGSAAFDLAAELSEALSDSGARPARATTSEDGFESLFRDFKRGVSRTLGEGDAETHFDLGIAYREMGLLEDAIGEFGHALASPTRRCDALHLMALCALDLGRAQDAVSHLEQALASHEVPGEQDAPMRFDLGRAYEAFGDRERALAAFRRALELDPEFGDAAERLEALERGEASGCGDAAGEAEAYESFDELVAESAESPVSEEAAPQYESFEDVFVDDDAAGAADTEERAADGAPDAGAAADAAPAVEPPPSAEAEPVAAPESVERGETVERVEPVVASEPAPEAEPAAESPRPAPRRRRKVSFV